MKKLLLSCFVLLSVLMLTGCGENKETGEIDYNAVYKDHGVTIKTYLKDGQIYYQIKSNKFTTSGEAELKDNKITMDMVTDKTTLEFVKGNIKITTDYEFMEAGNYKKSGEYTDDDFYEDYYGSSKYLTSKLNGVYKNGDKTIYVYQKDKKTICLLYTIEDVDSIIEPEETSEGVYESDFIDDYYTITMKDDTMIVEIKSEDETRTAFNGTYKKDSEITKEDILKLYMPR